MTEEKEGVRNGFLRRLLGKKREVGEGEEKPPELKPGIEVEEKPEVEKPKEEAPQPGVEPVEIRQEEPLPKERLPIVPEEKEKKPEVPMPEKKRAKEEKPKKEVKPPLPKAKKRKKIRSLALEEIEERLRAVETDMGGTLSKYAQHLLQRKGELLKRIEEAKKLPEV